MKKLLVFICVAVMLLAAGCQQTPQETEHIHTLIHNEAKAPTCVNNGIKEHWYCPDCNARFTDEAATEEVTFADLETEELGHKPGEDDGDCTTAVNCTVCGGIAKPAGTHTPGEDDGDCTTAIACTACGKEAVAAKAEHTPAEDDGDCTTAVKCTNCDQIVTEGKEVHIAAEDDGDCTTAVKCVNCDQIVTEAKEAHIPNADDGDCTTAITCSVCGKETTPAKSHDFGINNPTCGTCGKENPGYIAPAGDFMEGVGFEAPGNQYLFVGTTQDTVISGVTYADAGVSAPANGGSYALKVSHASNCWPNFRVNFGKTLKAGTVITFDFYGNYDYKAAEGVTKYMKLEIAGSSKGFATSADPNQVVWTVVETWRIATITLTADCDHLDLFYNVADGGHGEVPSWILLDNFKAVEPEVKPDPVGDIIEGLDFETAGNELWFVGTGEGSDATIERVSYADLGVTGPANGGSYGLKVSHTTNEYPTFRINFGKTLKAGTQIKFDAYAVTDGSALVLMLQDHGWQQVAYLVNGWRESLNWETTLIADCDHIDLVWERRGATEVPSSIIIDNIVAVEPN